MIDHADELSVPQKFILRERAREAIRSGRLPSRSQDRTLGGPGSGEKCAVCGELVTRQMTELEAEFNHDGATRGGERYRLHHLRGMGLRAPTRASGVDG